MSGFYSVHRSLFKKPIWLKSTAEQKVILIALLGMANHAPNEWEWNGEKVSVERGQTITSAASIMAYCGKGIERQNVRTALKRFEKLGFLTTQSTTSGLLITICNYSSYQSSENKPNHQPNQDLTKTQPTPNQRLTTNNNDNKNNNENKLNELFDKFYSVYPVKKSKEQARKAFVKLKPTEEFTDMLIADVTKRLLKDQGWKDKQYIKHPSTYLNNKSWTDEIDVVSFNGAYQSSGQQYAQPIRKPMPIPGRTA